MKLRLTDDNGNHGPEVEISDADTHANEGDWGWTLRIGRAITAARPRPRIHPQSGDLLRRRSDGIQLLAGSVWGSNGLDPDEWDLIRAADLPWPERAP